MVSKKFLIPIGTAVAALVPLKLHATAVGPTQPTAPEGAVPALPSVTPMDTDRVVQELSYRLHSEMHVLLLRQPRSGPLYAGHGSHMSHHSHGSHRSGY